MLRLTSADGSRRDFLQAGGATALGLSLPQLLAAPAVAGPTDAAFGRARACIVAFLFGGPSHIDLWDLKPEAPVEFRGEFRPIDTNVSGIRLGELHPHLARQTDKLCVVRSMTHEHPRHGWGLYYMLTGKRHNRPDLDAPPTPDDHPGLGALVTRLGRRSPALPPAITLPRWTRFLDVPNDYAGEKGGFLGSGYDPWLVKAEGDGTRFAPEGLALPVEVPPGRLDERRDLLAQVDRNLAAWGEAHRAYGTLRGRAQELLSSAAVRSAFDLGRESPRLRDHYGRNPFGQGLLLARRLVEAGTTLVQVNWHADGSDVKSPFWDTHKDNFNRLRRELVPPADQGLAALLDDLAVRGLLESTLVIVMGEFGRTPRVGQIVMNGATDKAGRDHWPHAYSVLMAGGGVRGGQVYGASDRRAAYVADAPVSPPDLQATVLHALGIPPEAPIFDRQGRPHAASDGQVVKGLF